MLLRAVAYTLIPVAATVGGAAGAAIRPPGRRLLAALQHLAAGIVFAAVALELVPPVREQGIGVAIAGFSIGIIAMLCLRLATERLEGQPREAAGPAVGVAGAVPLGLLLAIAIDVAIDGLVLGAGFAVESRIGLLLAVALTLELLFLGLSAAGALLNGGLTPRATVALCAGIAVLLPLGTAVGVLTLSNASASLLAVVLGFGAVALMYLVTEELLSEAHEVPETPLSTALFPAGFLVYLIMAEILG